MAFDPAPPSDAHDPAPPALPGSPIDESQARYAREHVDAEHGDDDSDEEISTAGSLEAADILRLSPIEARLLGALAEKALATPQNYPLSINSLATACNQTTNRDPLTHYTEDEIADELSRLKDRRLLRFVHPTSGRGVTKYRHVLDEYLVVHEADIALLSVLLVRGPQTVSELRARTERLHRFDSTTDIEEQLRSMQSDNGSPLAIRLEREPGHREPRWIQTLCPEQGELRAGTGTASDSPSAGHAAPAPQAARPSTPGLRDEVDQLKRELQQLRADFEAFRAEFG